MALAPCLAYLFCFLTEPRTSELFTDYKGRDTRCDKSRRQVASSALLLRQGFALIWSLRYVARIQTSLNSCDRSQRRNSVAVTIFFTCHTGRFVAATCRGDVSQRIVASCVSALNRVSKTVYYPNITKDVAQDLELQSDST